MGLKRSAVRVILAAAVQRCNHVQLYKGTVGVFAGLVTGLFSVLAYQGSVGNLTLETMIIIGGYPAQ